MDKEIIQKLQEVSRYIGNTCMHDKIVITVDGIYLEETKEFHPVDGTWID